MVCGVGSHGIEGLRRHMDSRARVRVFELSDCALVLSLIRMSTIAFIISNLITLVSWNRHGRFAPVP
jgi:hypothetical protein